MYHRSGSVAHTAKQWHHMWPVRDILWKDVMVAILKVRRHIWNRTLQSMHIYSRNIPAKFHPDQIWKDKALGFLEDVVPTRSTSTRTRWVAIWGPNIANSDKICFYTSNNYHVWFRRIDLTHCLNGHFPGKPELVSCCLDSQSSYPEYPYRTV